LLTSSVCPSGADEDFSGQIAVQDFIALADAKTCHFCQGLNPFGVMGDDDEASIVTEDSIGGDDQIAVGIPRLAG
jgi:hypothetical protein